jgi:type III pantothenate kinase
VNLTQNTGQLWDVTIMHKVCVAIDLGNSSATYGVFRLDTLGSRGRVDMGSIPHLSRVLAGSGGRKGPVDYLICSVVPHVSKAIIKYLRSKSSTNKVYHLGHNFHLKMPMRYQSRKLGADRLVNAYGAWKRYKGSCLIVDFGTAITFDIVSRKGVFEGGLIVPGVELAGRALSEAAELLPKWKKLKVPRGLIGHTTEQAMSSGLLNGYGALADGLIGKFKGRYGNSLRVIATGGFAGKIAPYSREIRKVDAWHTIKSLGLIYRHEVRVNQ